LEEVHVFTQLTDDLLDLVVHEKGYRHALYAAKDSGGGGGSCTGSSSSLTTCKICWD
jgi:hypothetical protein